MTEKKSQSTREWAYNQARKVHPFIWVTAIAGVGSAVVLGSHALYEGGQLGEMWEIIHKTISSQETLDKEAIADSFIEAMKAAGFENAKPEYMDSMFKSNGFDTIDEKGVSHRMEFVRDEKGIVTGVRDTKLPAFGSSFTAIDNPRDGVPYDKWVFHYEGHPDAGNVSPAQYETAADYYRGHGAKPVVATADAPTETRELIQGKGVSHTEGSTVAYLDQDVVDRVRSAGGFVDSRGRAWQIWVDKDGEQFLTRLPDTMKAGLPYQNGSGVWFQNGKLIE